MDFYAIFFNYVDLSEEERSGTFTWAFTLFSNFSRKPLYVSKLNKLDQ